MLLVDVKAQGHALQHPVAGVLRRGEVRLEHQADTHRVTPRLRHVDGSLERILQLQLASLDGNHLQDGQLGDEHLWILALQHAAFQVPARALQVKALDVRAVLQLLGNLRRVRVPRHLGVQRGLIERPTLVPARRLHQRGGVRLRDVQPREPHHRGFAVCHPVHVLLVPALEPEHPGPELLLRRRGLLGPNAGQKAVEERGGQRVELVGHANLADERLLQLLERRLHRLGQDVEPVELLQQHHLDRGRDTELLLDHRHVKQLGDLVEDILGDDADVILAAHTPAAARGPGLQVDEVHPQLLGRAGVVRDVRVGVQTKHLGRLVQGQGVDHLGVGVPAALRGHHVVNLLVLEKVERLEGVEEEIAEVLVEVGGEDASVERVRDASAVHSLADEVPERPPRELIVVVVKRLRQVRLDQLL
mmetsp:Transcript_7802/g.35411  ORF Transcript_7802/g.35411 Transcript_7802/m.35411 type:complete len:418 (+) Transcript_7802:111-1364(+)